MSGFLGEVHRAVAVYLRHDDHYLRPGYDGLKLRSVSSSDPSTVEFDRVTKVTGPARNLRFVSFEAPDHRDAHASFLSFGAETFATSTAPRARASVWSHREKHSP